MTVDKTPAMGAMPTQAVVSDTVLVKESQHSPVSKYVNKYYLRSLNSGNQSKIDKFPFVIGRSKECDLTISNKIISRKHAVILQEDKVLIIVNENSLNGIRVNNHKVKRVILQDGDEISFANEKYTFEVKSEIISVNNLKKHDEKPLHQVSRLQQTTAGDEYGTEEEGSITSDVENNHKKSASKRTKLIGFALLVTTVVTSGLYAYQHYMRQTQESRVFAMTASDNKANITNNQAGANTENNAKNADNNVQAPVASANEEDESNIKSISADDKPVDSVPLKKAEPRPVIQKKATAAKTIKPVIKSTSLKKTVLLEHQNSKEKISAAIHLYHSGHYADSNDALDKIKTSKRHQSEYRLQASQLQDKINELNTYYLNGNQAYADNKKEEAFINWGKLLNKHSVYFPSTESIYANEIKDKVANEYEQRGNQAYVNDEWVKAYQNWKHAVAIKPNTKIQQSINLMDAEIKELYRTGYRYETVNIRRAIEYWDELISKAPRDHEYYIKASAKLQWYNNKR